ncbi:UDP-forming cellulose synthase catalytic subunit [Aureimonas fodinaquatilis]|uniref:Cellulose synthase catalytic subunit [UDP-forming] n=1 Tax=Aureimonas fodinaquatilis TaxID=2565783 RepID=A0A5B0DR25_9HYPH|nr:UDP-forming cellulose synthase catalytic subunit [Aureimonas fodinaquatilis]KAA0968445.1 UDP-forming cellulose synthase catalytic subunit [Aureimonas fodinaquatilis]
MTVAAFILWVISAFLALTIVTLPVSVETQLIAVAVVLTIMAVIKALKLHGGWRLVALALGTSVVLRYVYWRTTSTLPPVNQLENFIPGLLVYLAEMYSVFMLFLSLFVVSVPLPPRPPRQAEPAELLPTVDVYVPTYNEDAELLANTLASCLAMDYPPEKMTVWLLDDGGTLQKRNSDDPETSQIAEARYVRLQKLCADLGARYLTRERNQHAKAGNLNNGMAHSEGQLIVVFDADHAPARDFLKETVGYFREDPKLFLVQTPHFFLNPDPIERNLRTFNHMPSENEMFYGVIQRGLDKWNAAFFCGSAAVLRRAALETTGGFSGVSITEDCETAVELHARGWNSIYVDKPLIAGLQPATFASFIGQRSRWAQGMMQILRYRFPPLKRGLSLPQRLCYTSSTLFWLFPFPRAIFLIAPLFYLFFDLQIFTASGGEFLAYTLTYMAVNLVMQNYMYGRYRWPWISELYEYVQTVHLLPAVVSVVLNPSKPTFKVTAKDESINNSRLSEIGLPFFIIFFILLIAVGVTIYRVYAEPYRADLTLVVGGWNLLNLIIAGCALGVVSERSSKRQTQRINVKRRCDVDFAGKTLPGTIEDVSVSGARVRLFGQLPAGASTTSDAILHFKPARDIGEPALPISVRNIEQAGNNVIIGCLFEPKHATDHNLIADLVFASSDQWARLQAERRTNPGVIRGTFHFLKIALFQTQRGLYYLFKERGRSSKDAAKLQARTQ